MFRIGEILEAARFAPRQIAQDQDGPSVTLQGGISDRTSWPYPNLLRFQDTKTLALC
jgi:hypothetical protein